MTMAKAIQRGARTLALGGALLMVFLLPKASAEDHVTLGRLFTHVGDFSLGEATNRTDYESVDAQTHRLYIAKMGSAQLLVFDTDKAKLLANREGYGKITGVLVVPELHRVYASVPGAGALSALAVGLGMLGLTSGTGKVVVFDAVALQEIARLPGGVFPDGIAFDGADGRLFVSDEFGGAVTAFDVKANKALTRIELKGEAGNVQYDRLSARIYVSVQSRDELAIIDPTRLWLVGRIKLGGCKHPHGLAIAPDAAIAYVACDENDVLVTIDLAAARVLRTLPVAHDPDVLAIDAGAHRLYVASESGTLSTFAIADSRAPIALGDVFVGEGAHAVAVDPLTHRLFLPLADVGGRCLLRVLLPRD
jgi:DNA-binding beta-propeller fold protein YncE